MIMSPHAKPTLFLWLGAVAMFVAASFIGLGAARHGDAAGWAFLSLILSAVLMAAAAGYLSRREDALTRYRRYHKPLAGPRPGARLGD
jgi:membrane protein implicated in regulation of membrane protease activity